MNDWMKKKMVLNNGWMDACMYVWMHAMMHVWMHACAFVCIFACMYACNVCVHVMYVCI